MIEFIFKSDFAYSVGYCIFIAIIFNYLFEKINHYFKTNIYKKYYTNKSSKRKNIEFTLYISTIYLVTIELPSVLTDKNVTMLFCVYSAVIIFFWVYYSIQALNRKLTEFHNKLPD
ncbi:hypothetical protein RaK2_00310 [Klebsiella phage vB_KleM_RaK2]|uniref:Uncharacterized protein n=1 Tax=Klebsiella phage vB_KleM_RaK2 TaxID=1147094 RepID=H6X4B7_9CAUD|nr:hypothetical protein F403_gp225 [Klebsiella phage vB_KleM_RaK2]AFA44583.1 hypothetical protein RaK2_00310 [Klebsiella phage vB_KleM_RaK2]